MSSGRPARRTGVELRVVLDALAEQALGLRRPEHRRVDEARRDRVDRDALRAELERERLGEADHPGLADAT